MNPADEAEREQQFRHLMKVASWGRGWLPYVKHRAIEMEQDPVHAGLYERIRTALEADGTATKTIANNSEPSGAAT